LQTGRETTRDHGLASRDLRRGIGLLAIIMAVIALLTALTIYAQVRAGREAEAIRQAILLNADALRLQLDEETGIRGYLATSRTSLLEPYTAATRQLDGILSELADVTTKLNLNGGHAVLVMQRFHDRWVDSVAVPTLHNRKVDVTSRQVRGKTLLDEFRNAQRQLRRALLERAHQVDRDNERATVLLFALGLIFMLGVAAVGIRGARRESDLTRSLQRERNMVETLQGVFLSRNERLPNTSIGSCYASATDEAAVGGDLLDVRRLEDPRGYVLIADVSGKGVSAAVDTALVRYSVNAIARQVGDPAEILATFNRLFLDAKKSSSETFVSLFVGIFNWTTFSLNYASAGHSTAFLRRGSVVEQLDVTGPLIGLYPDDSFKSHMLKLAPNDTLVLATDGLTEARNANGTMLTDRGAMRWIGEVGDRSPQLLVDELQRRLLDFIGGRLNDDLAILALKVVGKAAATSDEVLDEIAEASRQGAVRDYGNVVTAGSSSFQGQ
jgi:serine phosphatase RsbU (regulator of sigma subunit)